MWVEVLCAAKRKKYIILYDLQEFDFLQLIEKKENRRFIFDFYEILLFQIKGFILKHVKFTTFILKTSAFP